MFLQYNLATTWSLKIKDRGFQYIQAQISYVLCATIIIIHVNGPWKSFIGPVTLQTAALHVQDSHILCIYLCYAYFDIFGPLNYRQWQKKTINPIIVSCSTNCRALDNVADVNL